MPHHFITENENQIHSFQVNSKSRISNYQALKNSKLERAKPSTATPSEKVPVVHDDHRLRDYDKKETKP